MSRVEQMERAITELDPSELKAFREWFLQYDSEVWDRQIESDAADGSLARLAQRALRDHEAGRTTKL